MHRKKPLRVSGFVVEKRCFFVLQPEERWTRHPPAKITAVVPAGETNEACAEKDKSGSELRN